MESTGSCTEPSNAAPMDEQRAHQLARVAVPDGGLPTVGGREVDACEAGVKDVGTVGISGLKGDLPCGIVNLGAVNSSRSRLFEGMQSRKGLRGSTAVFNAIFRSSQNEMTRVVMRSISFQEVSAAAVA